MIVLYTKGMVFISWLLISVTVAAQPLRAQERLRFDHPAPLENLTKELSGTCANAAYLLVLEESRTKPRTLSLRLGVNGQPVAESEIEKIFAIIQAGQRIADAVLSECIAEGEEIRVKARLVVSPPRKRVPNVTFELIEFIIHESGQISDIRYN